MKNEVRRRVRRAPRGAALVALALAFGSSGTRLAEAEPETCREGDRDCGREAFTQGTRHFDQSRYEEARRWFLSARAAAPHPIISFNLALCYARLGRPSLARAELTPLVSDLSLEASLRERAGNELAAAEAALSRVRVDSTEPRSNVIELNGQPVEAPTGELVVDPGVHRLRISNRGLVVFDQELTLEPGEQLQLRVTNRSRAIEVVVVPETGHSSPAAPLPSPGPPPKRSGLSPAWFYVSGSATLLLGGATLWSGLDVNDAHDDYRAELPRLSQGEANARVANGHARERRTNWLLGATAVAAAGTALLGVVLVDWQPKQGAAATLSLKPAGAEFLAVF